MIILSVITGVLFYSNVQGRGQFDFNQNCREIYKSVFDLRFQTASRLIRLEQSVNPENLIPLSLENTRRCISLFISEDPALFRYYKKLRNETLEQLENSPDGSPFKLFTLAKYHLDWAFAELKFRDFYHAAIDLKNAHDLFLENDRLFPHFLINKTGLGVIHVTLGIIPGQYQWILDMIGMQGSVGQGISELEAIAGYNGDDEIVRIYKAEALFSLTFISMNIEGNASEHKWVWNQETEPGAEKITSPLLIYCQSSFLMKTGKNAEALKMLQLRKNIREEYPFCYLDYLEGIARLNMLDFQAEEYFLNFLKRFTGTNYRASAMQKLAWIALLNGDRQNYRQQMGKLSNIRQLWTDEDKQAVMEAEKGVLPDAGLLKARLLFDGGYYQESIRELKRISSSGTPLSSAEKLEYHYRLGRNLQMTGDEPNAIINFSIAIENGKDSEAWFPAAAAFQLGNIYEGRKDWKNAEKYYLACLSMKNREYRSSLRQKSKIGLERVREAG